MFAKNARALAGAIEMSGENTRVLSKAGFWDLIQPCRRKLYNFILKSLNFSVEADDVFQEAVLHAFQYFASFDQDRDFEPWLFAIAHNEIRHHYRRVANEAHLPELERPAADDASHSRELVRDVFRYAGRLKSRQREIFFLFYDSGFSVAEIAALTGLGEGNIRFQLHRARNALKKIMGA